MIPSNSKGVGLYIFYVSGRKRERILGSSCNVSHRVQSTFISCLYFLPSKNLEPVQCDKAYIDEKINIFS